MSGLPCWWSGRQRCFQRVEDRCRSYRGPVVQPWRHWCRRGGWAPVVPSLIWSAGGLLAGGWSGRCKMILAVSHIRPSGRGHRPRCSSLRLGSSSARCAMKPGTACQGSLDWTLQVRPCSSPCCLWCPSRRQTSAPCSPGRHDSPAAIWHSPRPSGAWRPGRSGYGLDGHSVWQRIGSGVPRPILHHNLLYPGMGPMRSPCCCPGRRNSEHSNGWSRSPLGLHCCLH